MGAPSMQENVDLSIQGESSDKMNATATACLDSTYKSLIQQYLSMLCLDNALFLAERNVAHHKTHESLYLLALCHYRAGSPQSAQVVLEQAGRSTEDDPNTQYLLAKCYFDLQQYGRAEDALLTACRTQYRASGDTTADADATMKMSTNANFTHTHMDDWILSTTPCPIPNGAAGLHLLANICRHSNRKARAMQYYRMSLQLDPMMWSSYEALCELGDKDNVVDPVEIFGVSPAALTLSMSSETLPNEAKGRTDHGPLEERGVLTPSFGLPSSLTPTDAVAAAGLPATRPDFSATTTTTTTPMSAFLPKTSLFPGSTSSSVMASRSKQPRGTMFETPNLTPIAMLTEKSYLAGEGFSNPVVVRRASRVASRLYYPPSPETMTTRESSSNVNKPRSLFLSGLGDGASSVLSTSIQARSSFARMVDRGVALRQDSVGRGTAAAEEGTATRAGATSGLFASRNGGALFPETDVVDDENKAPDADTADEAVQEVDEKSVKTILELLCMLGAAHKQICQYRCREAIQTFHRLPQEQFHTGWVLHQVGRAYFEMADYRTAQRYLELMQKTEPHRIKGLEVLSTTLWQLKKEVELSHLAQRAVDFDRLAPESWCVVGNCFSLQKDHETALTFFRRSIQLDPSFTYSHTLSGHEYMAVEDFEKAKACYRDAIRADERHYNAWYGLGTIYFRQEQYELAEYHFQRAIEINPQSAVLLCHLGLAQNNNGKAYDALETFSLALKVNPRNPQARYQRANIFTALDRPHEALAELEKVRDLCPREASVHYGMGKVLKRLGRTEQAMRCFLIALDLEPKDTNLSIKAAMEKMDDPDIPEEEISTY